MLTRVFAVWAKGDPLGAAKTALSIKDKHIRYKMFSQVIRSWSEKDPARAAHWLTETAGITPNLSLVAGTLSNWHHFDLHAAFEWVSSLPEGAGREYGIEEIVRSALRSDPESALPLIEEFHSDEKRELWLSRINQKLEREK